MKLFAPILELCHNVTSIGNPTYSGDEAETCKMPYFEFIERPGVMHVTKSGDIEFIVSHMLTGMVFLVTCELEDESRKPHSIDDLVNSAEIRIRKISIAPTRVLT